MQITPGQRRSIVAALIVLILLLLFLVWYFLLRGEKAPVPVPEEIPPSLPIIDTTPSATEVVPVTAEAASARVVAMNFVERFGTYSTDSPFMNVGEVKELSTPEYHTSLLLSAVVNATSGEFLGVTTRALAVNVKSGSEESGSVVYTVSAQNEVQRGTRSNFTIEYKSATLTVVKRGNHWLVDSFQWN